MSRWPCIHSLREHEPARTWRATLTPCQSLRRRAPDLDRLLDRQAGALTRQQALQAGLSDHAIEHRLRRGHWRRAFPGVYLGERCGPASSVWAALLACGPGAVASHETAAHLLGLQSANRSSLIHVTVPADRRLDAKRGVRVHRTRQVETLTRAVSIRSIPCTRIEDTAIDLVAAATHVEHALALPADAVQRRLTTPPRLQQRIIARPVFKNRQMLLECVADVATGANSMLELHYLRDVERAHRLPSGLRQRRVVTGRHIAYRDVEYPPFGTRAELDGRLGHDDATQRWRDLKRDNGAAVDGEVVLRYGFADVLGRPCHVATQVVAVLKRRGWTGLPRRCGGSCRLEP